MPESIFGFAEALRGLLQARSPEGFETHWGAVGCSEMGWSALAPAWRRDVRLWERGLDEVDGLLLRLLDRLPVLMAQQNAAAVRLRTFRGPELERLQHATAAALVAQRFGNAGLRTVVADEAAPLARRYFAFFALAERHPPDGWPVFARYLIPGAHHAFVGAAAEAARFYPRPGATERLMKLFEAIRTDLHLRAFLSPRILESLFVLDDRVTLPFFRDLLISGHTDARVEYCEVTRALVMVRRFTGNLEPNVKYADVMFEGVEGHVSQAEAAFARQCGILNPVKVI
jgi:hypothetical protein